MAKVLVFGTFDILHRGHINFFEQARKYGTLYVVVARDINVKKFKNKLPINNENERLKKVWEIADKAFLGDINNIYKPIENIKPDIICLGYDQKAENLLDELTKRNMGIKIIRLKPYKEEVYKSSKLKK